MTGMIFDLQRFCLNDGPGIRTTVFLKGCPLRCVWCHNPESWEPGPELAFDEKLCIGCGSCFRLCPSHGLRDGRHTIGRQRCSRCFRCAEECPSGALARIGRPAEAKT